MVKYCYNAWGVPTSLIGDRLNSTKQQLNCKIIGANSFLCKGYYYDHETGLYYNVTRYYNPQWGRFLNADDVSYLDPQVINGLNLFAYCNNNPVFFLDSSGCFPKVSIFPSKPYDPNNFWDNIFTDEFRPIAGQRRNSVGWEIDDLFFSSRLGRVGWSHYYTETKGGKGLFYAFSGSTIDSGAIFTEGIEYYAGIGINFWNLYGFEIQAKAAGVGASINLFGATIAVDINALGMTSLTIGHTRSIDDHKSRTDGFTIGLNTGVLVAVATSLYEVYKYGDLNRLEKVWQILFGK